jgi:flagellar assembly protein FliH
MSTFPMCAMKADNITASPSPFSMRDVEEVVRRVLLKARVQAANLVAVARQEAEAIKARAAAEGKQEGKEQGLAEGLDEGRAAGREQALAEYGPQLAAAVEAFAGAATRIDVSRRELEAAVLGEVVELAAAIARRVTKRQGLIDPGVLAANVAEALKVVVRGSDVRVAVHPAQLQTLAAALPGLRPSLPHLGHVELVEDATLTPGGCRVYSQDCSVDGDLDTQLDRVIDDLLPSNDGRR